MSARGEWNVPQRLPRSLGELAELLTEELVAATEHAHALARAGDPSTSRAIDECLQLGRAIEALHGR